MQPLGRDEFGNAYWTDLDEKSCTIKIYQENQDDETWHLVASNREEVARLITRLTSHERIMPTALGIVDEDSSSNSVAQDKLIKQNDESLVGDKPIEEPINKGDSEINNPEDENAIAEIPNFSTTTAVVTTNTVDAIKDTPNANVEVPVIPTTVPEVATVPIIPTKENTVTKKLETNNDEDDEEEGAEEDDDEEEEDGEEEDDDDEEAEEEEDSEEEDDEDNAKFSEIKKKQIDKKNEKETKRIPINEPQVSLHILSALSLLCPFVRNSISFYTDPDI